MTMASAAAVVRLKWPVALCVSLALGSSTPDERKWLRRLIGDGTLAQAQVGPSEEIDISLTHGYPTYARHLQFELGPDRILTVARYRVAFDELTSEQAGASGIERIDQVRLSAAASADFRSRMALFRPETLGPDGPFVQPNGCHYISDAGEEVAIDYGAPNNQFGAYLRQSDRECGRGSAVLLDRALREILATLPRTEAAEGFIW